MQWHECIFPTWSPPDIPCSGWAGRVEEWAATNLLTLAKTPSIITQRGVDHEWDLVIDLAWYNEAVVQAFTFTDFRTDWEGSLGSDHAMIHISGQLLVDNPPPDPTEEQGFILDPKKKGEWIQLFWRGSPGSGCKPDPKC